MQTPRMGGVVARARARARTHTHLALSLCVRRGALLQDVVNYREELFKEHAHVLPINQLRTRLSRTPIRSVAREQLVLLYAEPD